MKKIILLLCLSANALAYTSQYLKELQEIEAGFKSEAKKAEVLAKPEKKVRARQKVKITDLEQIYFKDQVNLKASAPEKTTRKRSR